MMCGAPLVIQVTGSALGVVSLAAPSGLFDPSQRHDARKI
jgi:hypothetical protein